VTDHIGNFDYTVHILPAVVPPITDGTTQGGISAQVTAVPDTGVGKGVSTTPEPSALFLAGPGLLLAAGYRRRLARRS
jgi:hypothetical protein